MDFSDISLRDLKKARTKIALFEACLDLIGDKMFREVMLDDICRKAEVSRVTFFKFFQRKEDLLIYFMRIWLTGRIIEIEVEQKRGFAAIRYLLHKQVEHTEQWAGMMPSLISFLVEQKMHPKMPELSEAEVRMLFPNHEEMGALQPDMYVLFHQCMEEAHADGHLRVGLTVEMAVKLLFTIFYGAFLTAHLYNEPNMVSVYEEHLHWLEQK